MAEDGSLIGMVEADEDAVDHALAARRTWNKRKQTSGLDAASKRAIFIQPAGTNTAAGGMILPRNNEVFEASGVASSSIAVPPDHKLVVAVASAHTKGATDDVALLVDHLDRLVEDESDNRRELESLPAKRRSLYALIDGHNGRLCAERASSLLPQILARRVHGLHDSAAIKEAIRAGFAECDALLIEESLREGWDDGACVSGLLLDLYATPPRAYAFNLGSSQAFACAKAEGSLGTGKAVSVAKVHTAAESREKQRVLHAGGTVGDGLISGRYRAARSLGDASAKGCGIIIATPEIVSFEVTAAQRFVVVGSHGMSSCGLSGQQVVDKLYTRLPNMDTRRAELAATLADESRLAQLSADKVRAMHRELQERNHEEAALADVLKQVAEARKPRQHEFSMMLVRMLQAKEKAAPFAFLATQSRAVASHSSLAPKDVCSKSTTLEEEAPVAAVEPKAVAETAASTSACMVMEEELDEEERALIAAKQKQREEEAARELQAKASAPTVVDFF